MSRYAGGAFGINLTDFMGEGPDYGGIGNQAQMDNARAYATGELLNADLESAIMGAKARVDAAKHLGKAQLAATPGAGQSIMSQLPSVAGGFASMLGNFGGGGGGNMASLDSTPMTVNNAYGSSVSYYDPNLFDGVGDF